MLKRFNSVRHVDMMKMGELTKNCAEVEGGIVSKSTFTR